MFRDSRRVRQLLLLMILSSITLITIDYRSGSESPFRGLRRSVGTVFGPIQRGVASAVRPVGNALSTLGNVGNLADENKRLKAERAKILGQARTNEDKQRQYDDAMDLLDLVNTGQYRTVAAHVIGAAPTNFTWTVTIDAGSNRGIRKNDTVVNSSGLVGRVIEASLYTSTVLLAIDLQSTVGARLAYSGEQGLVRGNGPSELNFEVTPATTEVRVGQPITTAGSTFVPGVPIGEVMETRAAPGAVSRTVRLKPYVNFSNLDLVGVVRKQERKTDLDVLVPPAPSSTASPSAPSLPACPTPAVADPSTPTSASAEPESAPEEPEGPSEPCLGSMPARPRSTPTPAPSP